MTNRELLRLRLYNQFLARPKFLRPEGVVFHLGAVQSQDYQGAKWAIGQRIVNGTNEIVEKAFNNGEILRTHVLRPTWHFISPNDIRWMLELSAPRIKQKMLYYNRQLNLTDAILKKAQDIFKKELKGNNFKTRHELRQALFKNGLDISGQKLGHTLMWAELDTVICSGPRIGKSFTYALFSERAPNAKSLLRDDALNQLTKRYFQSRGPAQAKDFAWWSGLTVNDALQGIRMNQPQLLSEDVNGMKYFYFGEKEKIPTDEIYLLSNYDEFGISYLERSNFFDPKYKSNLGIRGNANFQHMVLFRGIIIGTWKQVIKKNNAEITALAFTKFTNTQKLKLKQAAARYEIFLNLHTSVKFEA